MMCEGFMPRNISSNTTAGLITVSEIMLVLISWHTGLVCSFVKEPSKPPGCSPEGRREITEGFQVTCFVANHAKVMGRKELPHLGKNFKQCSTVMFQGVN